ncbi:MAG TPA: hypothetical protein VGR00_05920, partial [Thermoanaerobaculia bacterium]|nr:hypothetical protein [Thermoanaerobaculia bacterium]
MSEAGAPLRHRFLPLATSWPAFSIAALLLLAGAFTNRDLLSGRATPCFRDIGTTQRPSRALYATLGPSALNPYASFGQTYYGNPNLVLAYPFPKDPRWLGVHLLLHLAIGLVGAWLFFRRLVRNEEAALLGALAYGLSGYVLSSCAFLNATTTLAWLPWLLASVHAARRGGRLSFASSTFGAAASSMLLVAGGEPALGTIAILLAASVALTSTPGTRLRSLTALALGGAIGAVALSPWILEVL